MWGVGGAGLVDKNITLDKTCSDKGVFEIGLGEIEFPPHFLPLFKTEIHLEFGAWGVAGGDSGRQKYHIGQNMPGKRGFRN